MASLKAVALKLQGASESPEAGIDKQAKPGPPLVFVNKILLEENDVHLFMCYLWLLSQYNSRTE